MMFMAKLKLAAMVTATMLLIGAAGVGTFLAAQPRPIAGSSPATVPASQPLPMPKPRHIGEILSGTIVAVDGKKFVLAL